MDELSVYIPSPYKRLESLAQFWGHTTLKLVYNS